MEPEEVEMTEYLESISAVMGLVTKYFVLNPHHQDAYGRASRVAILAYADNIRQENPLLATGLQLWLDDIDRKHPIPAWGEEGEV